jgi:hypothetical protein
MGAEMSGEWTETDRLPHLITKYQASGQRRMNPQMTFRVLIGPARGTKPKTCKLYDDVDDGDDDDDDDNNNNNNNLTKVNLTPEQNLITRRGAEV